MSSLIDKGKVADKISDLFLANYPNPSEELETFYKEVLKIVVNEEIQSWISVKDRLPEPNTAVLVYYDVRLAKLENSFDTNSKKLKDDTASAVSDLNARLNCLEASHKCHRNDIDKLRWQIQALEEDNKHLKERLYKSNHALNEIDKALKESGEFGTWLERRKVAQQ